MSEAKNLGRALSQAQDHERTYNWLRAVDVYNGAIALLPERELSKRAELSENIGHAYYRLAFQASSLDEFREGIRRAISAYEEAGLFSERAGVQGRILRCRAMAAFLKFWIVREASEKGKLIDEAWEIADQALNYFQEGGDPEEYARTYLLLSKIAFFLENPSFQENVQRWKEIADSMVRHGQRLIRAVSNKPDVELVARINAAIAYFLFDAIYAYPEVDEWARRWREALGYWDRAVGLSEERALLYFGELFLCWEILGAGSERIISSLNKALEYGKKTGDRLVVGSTFDWLAHATFWRATGTEDPDEKRKLIEKALHYAEEARVQYATFSFTSPRGPALWTGAPWCEYYWALSQLETDSARKRELLEKAVPSGREGVRLAEETGWPLIITGAHLNLSKALTSLAKLETGSEQKKAFLEEALLHKNSEIALAERAEPFTYWNLGVSWNYLADIKTELARITQRDEEKRKLAQEAIQAKEDALKLCVKALSFWERTGASALLAPTGERYVELGTLRANYHHMTNDKAPLKKAIEAFEEASRLFQKLKLPGRIAECHWRAAQAYDALDEHLEAAGQFMRAFDNYHRAAEKIPQLENLYREHASYMEAWSSIEKARHHHGRREYAAARGYYERAADLHRSTKHWDYLALNYSAWASVEYGEDLSEKENSVAAIGGFEEATRLFEEGKNSIQTQLEAVQSSDEKQLGTRLVNAAGLRRDYCIARIAMEEAKILDKNGEHLSSSKKYDQASKTFEKIAQVSESDQVRQEVRLLTGLAKARKVMVLAEAKSSPELYREASSLFEEARDFSDSEKESLLLLGHSRFCRALEAGTKFADTGDSTLHTQSVRELESAAKYYLNAGFQKASEYAEASKLLFDAYVFMEQANIETGQEKKARLYLTAEKVLQASADSFIKSDHPEKRDQVLRLLTRVQRERELAMSLMELLEAPSIVSSTAVFSTPTSAREEPVGIETFDRVNVQARIIANRKNLKVGETLDLEIELANAGRAQAQLLGVEGLIQTGFELTKSEKVRVEGEFLSLKGRTLEPLKTEEVILSLRTKHHGKFTLRPRLVYADENGDSSSLELEPLQVNVRELGMLGWLKGETEQ